MAPYGSARATMAAAAGGVRAKLESLASDFKALGADVQKVRGARGRVSGPWRSLTAHPGHGGARRAGGVALRMPFEGNVPPHG